MDGQGLPSKTFDFMKRQRPPSEGILQELQKRQRPPSRTSYDEKPRPPGLQKRQMPEKPRPPSRRDVELMKRQRPPAMNVPLSVKRRHTSFDLMKRQRPPSESILQEVQKRQRPPSSDVDMFVFSVILIQRPPSRTSYDVKRQEKPRPPSRRQTSPPEPTFEPVLEKRQRPPSVHYSFNRIRRQRPPSIS